MDTDNARAQDAAYSIPLMRGRSEAGEATVRTSLSREEMAFTAAEDGGTFIASGQYQGHVVTVRTRVGRPKHAPPGVKVEPEPYRRHVAAESEHRQYFRREEFEGLPGSEVLTGDELVEACVRMVSDLLCGVGLKATATRFVDRSEADYFAAVVDLPEKDGARRGRFLLSVENGEDGSALRLRVMGQSQSYSGSHSYDATASAFASSCDHRGLLFRGSDDLVVKLVAESLLQGAPATHACLGVEGSLLTSAATARADIRGLYLTGLERMVARRIIEWADRQKAADEALAWAQSGPEVWNGVGELHSDREIADELEVELLEELVEVGALDPDYEWIFRPEISFDAVRHDFLL